ncbi:S41 family peptidase [Winogradskyella flava]|uniref:S41 family peptidase n=1 Tax=Winogradskyella flava TaxID=1884876 RepID=UPI00248F64BD|nr:S41 family peptidase [Winogradskyella flava]
MNFRLLITLCLFISLNSFGQSKAKFSKQEVIEDLNTLKESLVDTHYNLFAYTSEQTFNSAYEEVKNSINKDSITLFETTNLFQRLISTANNGHTEIDFPKQAYTQYAYEQGTLFPLELAFENNKALIRKNWSKNNNLIIGSEVLTINGEEISEILSKIYRQVSAERPYFKNAKIEMYSFPRYYWQVYGKQDKFEVEVRSNKVIKKYSIKAINLIEDFETKRNEVLNASINLKFHNKSAYLNPGNFEGNEQKYQKFIDSSFTEIRKRNSKYLIVDLRNNKGGNDSFSDYLISFFANKPFKWHSRFTLKTSQLLKEHTRQNSDTTDIYFQKILTHKNGDIYDYVFDEYQPQPKSKRFYGKVYVLINRQSHSQSAVSAAQIQDYKFGTIVGEETGDYPSLYAARFQYSLPNTEILVSVSKGYIVRVNGSEKREGVIPDIYIKDHLLDETDEILTELINRINKG